MTDAPRFPPMIEFEAFGAGVGSALVCGALSVVVPLLVTPAATLAALAVAGWVSLARRRGSLRRCDFGSGRVIALSVLGVATAIFLVAPPLFASFRGLVLAGGLLPLFAFERTRSFGPGPEFSRS